MGEGDFTSVPIDMAFSLDALSASMALVVTGVGFLIHLYSTKYMEDDPAYHRFFSYLNLFIFSMLVLILGDSLPILFIGWEGVGLCSYLLIGFWYEEGANAAAGKKAFITNRIGDFGLLVAMGLLVVYAGALDWTGLDQARDSLVRSVKLWPIGAEVPIASLFPESIETWINEPRHVNIATLVGLALFLGCAGKSAQIPLYVWLPDAMAGPTPVSALIHAATMVTAGVYLVCRMAGIFVLSPAAMFTIAFLGACTALLAATIALVQNDIKKVLAYSTVSQLGYMFLGVGVGAFTAGFYHVLTHAFFKACLFLGAGSVIHAMHARIHDHDASQDLRNMGGLRKYMPYTFATFMLAWAAIAGVPFTSGFFSKDEILLKAQTSFIAVPQGGTIGTGLREIQLWEWPEWGAGLLYTFGAATAVLTAFYMTRLTFGIFFGDFKGWKVVKRYKSEAEAHHDHGHTPASTVKLRGPKPHESPWQMTAPLVILAFLSLTFGWLNNHLFHTTVLDDWLAPVFAKASQSVMLVEGHESAGGTVMIIAVACEAAGIGFAWWLYAAQRGEPAQRWAEQWPRLHQWAVDKWRVDEFYEETILGAVDSLAEFAVWFDRWVVDGILARASAFLVAVAGTVLRFTQTGRVHAYGAVMAGGLAVVGWFLLSPHADARVTEDHGAGKYSITAAPGFGYSYRFVDSAELEQSTQEFSRERKLSFDLDVDESRSVTLEVKNSFGSVASKQYSLMRPQPDLSSPRGTTRIDVQQGADGQLVGVPQAEPTDAPAEQRAQGQAAQVLEVLRGAQRRQPMPSEPAPAEKGGQNP
jgi:NADH-quinone oxidoreductase subunit L